MTGHFPFAASVLCFWFKHLLLLITGCIVNAVKQPQLPLRFTAVLISALSQITVCLNDVCVSYFSLFLCVQITESCSSDSVIVGKYMKVIYFVPLISAHSASSPNSSRCLTLFTAIQFSCVGGPEGGFSKPTPLPLWQTFSFCWFRATRIHGRQQTVPPSPPH